jgi:hypothetical protein
MMTTTFTSPAATTPASSAAGVRPRPGGLRPFRTTLRGHPFAAAPPGATPVGPDLRAHAVREPDNPADPLAVAVWAAPADGSGPPWRLGYLDRVVAARLAPRLDDGAPIAVAIEGLVPEPDGRWHRPVVRVEVGATPSGRPGTGRGLWGRPPGVVRRTVRR